MKLRTRTIDQLRIEDELAFRSIEPYLQLKEVLRQARYKFRVLPAKNAGRWDRALFLNLTFWGGGGDVLVTEALAADVVTHVAWHHLSHKTLDALGVAHTADAMFFGEAIASAYDVYLLGMLLRRSKRSSFLRTQTAAMADSANAAGLSAKGFASLLQGLADDPHESFEALRSLLFTASTSLLAAPDVEAAFAILQSFDKHRFAPLLHHYELSTWVLYARAYASGALEPVASIRALDRQLQESPNALDDLHSRWCPEP